MPKVEVIQAKTLHKCFKCGKVIRKFENYYRASGKIYKVLDCCLDCGLEEDELFDQMYLFLTGHVIKDWRSFDTIEELIDELDQIRAKLETEIPDIKNKRHLEITEKRYKLLEECIHNIHNMNTFPNSDIDKELQKLLKI